MIQVTFTPGTSAQAALVGQLMAQYLALDEQPQEPVRTTSGLIAGAQEEAAAPAPKRTRRAAAATDAAAPSASSNPATELASEAPTSVTSASVGGEDPKPVAEPSAQEAPAAEPELTLEVVRAKLTEVSKAGKATEVKALLAALGVANLTAVPKEAYAKLMADAAAL
jgi:light-harvesting protein B-800-850 alpha chain